MAGQDLEVTPGRHDPCSSAVTHLSRVASASMMSDIHVPPFSSGCGRAPALIRSIFPASSDPAWVGRMISGAFSAFSPRRPVVQRGN